MNKLFKRHSFLMILGCLVPVLAIGFFALFGISQKSLLVLLVLACPLGHIFLMRGHDEKHHK
ncbi:hypothetical protein A2697_02165 [Candidatus Curtissbacteria bacterium RIFCSPHIGHO2_01_FULL_41_44]|uniref:DUF2933 domain-containing protein n=1 Tax=Candidatus Curtissbacteria bacterium RIFCSPLOWO2_01_FULL_42_50 TaxID=1797730 RepID=A0A1F5H3X8_9BACT|nr:MAG: hypothetical protein A2697_02165 [Candidatus Curtissbacteria bacterium RIFCSPHIGHO2_01_FULL_41_44]OGD94662.1 MAG: hypothetical protein A3C33_01315 [Candidatus Curtissbacteria bacterium RIFCSPHIGHO2_02_FULL_42_58]OGD96858.1 MAG: hypothetical protein A3E71_03105 [Candidatus Curtissbacteria bacterium RIFCSPHIGHO2_12_FULL_42_33]OGD98747.1 MAG: hypothetical protein A3B54_04875 [Candidatus Curtissbacteria bacterium RIFCSPLOWO2_01_FULL_42_50]OGE02248.1 MAG: hypothetical protein A3G16_01180 [Ca